MSKYSIVLPVRNGGEYLKQCVSSILSQTVNDFNLEILDNCSTDGSLEWVNSIKDQRVRIYPSSEPLSIEENWGRIVTIKKNEFMTFIGHDDILDENFLEEMGALIDIHPNASIYQTHFRYIDTDGNILNSCKPMDESQSSEAFLAFFLSGMFDLSIGQMVRSSDFDSLGGIPSYPSLLFADFELWMELIKKSYRASTKVECCSYRIHKKSTTNSSSKLKYYYAFNRMIDYFLELKKDIKYSNIFEKYGLNFLKPYCKSISHHLLRVPKEQRHGITVVNFIIEMKKKIDILIPDNQFFPSEDFSIKMGLLIDRHWVLQNSFLLFKKIYSKPLLK